MLVCCYALRSSILEIHLFGEVPGGVRYWCFAMGINLALLQLVTTETGYCRARWVSVVRSPTRTTRWSDVVLRAAIPRVCSNRPRNAVVVSVCRGFGRVDGYYLVNQTRQR